MNLEYPLDPRYDLETVLPNMEKMVEEERCSCLSLADQSEPGTEFDVYQADILHLAAMYGHNWLVTRLLNLGCKVNRLTCCFGYTPLHCVALSYFRDVAPEVATTLIQAGAEVDIRDHNKNSPLHLAVECQHPAVVELLLKKHCQLDILNNRGETPLLNAVKMRDTTIVSQLVTAGADPNIRDDRGLTALAVAIRQQNVEFIQMLLNSGKCDVNLMGRGVHGQELMHPLYYAAYQGTTCISVHDNLHGNSFSEFFCTQYTSVHVVD